MGDSTKVRSITAVLLLFLVVSLLLLSLPLVRGEEKGKHKEADGGKQQPDPAERAIGITGFMNQWDAVKTWAKLSWMNFRPPESWYRRSASRGEEVVKEAAVRSFESGKETVEQAAASAGQAAGEAVHKTTEKVKRAVSAVSAGEGPNAEL